MNQFDLEKLTLQSYNVNANAWDKSHAQDYLYWTKERKYFTRLLPQGKILEIGSGGGHDARILIDLGYDYVGIDPSQGLLKIAKTNNPTGLFLEQNVYNLDFPKDYFDGFWAAEVLLHIPKAKLNFVLQNIGNVVKRRGIGFISVKQGEGELFIEEDRGEHGIYKRLFSFYSHIEFKNILERNGFKVVKSYIHPPDGDTIWMTYLVRVNK